MRAALSAWMIGNPMSARCPCDHSAGHINRDPRRTDHPRREYPVMLVRVLNLR